MKSQNAISLNFPSRTATLAALVACSLTLASRVAAIEDPPNCNPANGGMGPTYVSGLNFTLSQAHAGDDVTVIPNIGMVAGACRAINVTGSVYVATGRLTNFLDNASLEPGILFSPRCTLHITPELIGAGVNSPHGNIPGVPGTVRAVENVDGSVLSGTPTDVLNDGFHTASITIVTPAIRVVQQPTYPAGQTCFPAGQVVRYSGYVTNAGDITLTNVLLTDDRSGQIQLLDPANSQPLSGNVILPPGATALFATGFTPTADETSAGSATSQLTASARDTTMIGGPNAAATHSISTASALCGAASSAVVLTNCRRLADGQFQFDIAGSAGKTYQIQASSNLSSPNWATIGTVSKSLTFVDADAATNPVRFYRAVELK